MDFPIKSQDKIHQFFDDEDREYISWHVNGEHNDYFMDKIHFYYPLLKFVGKGEFDGPGRKKAFMRSLVRLQWRLLELQKKLNIYRTKKYKNIEFYKGDQWFSITHDFAEYIIKNERNILRMYNLSNTPDEMVIPTLAMNSIFRERAENNSLRQIDWHRGTPYEYTVDDYEELINNNNFFARKISYDKEPLLVNNLIRNIHGLNDQRNEPLVSIIVPCYNVEKYMDECVGSLLAQTYKNIEILLIDDGSTDSTGEIARDFAKRNNNVIYIHRVNGGLSAARNTGLDFAKGEYVSFVDSDDWVEPDYTRKLLDAIENDYSDMAVCGYIKEQTDTARVSFDGCKVISPHEAMKALGDIYPKENVLLVIAWNKLYRKELFEDLRFKEGVIHEDEFMSHRVISRADSISVLSDCLYHYRIRENSITGGSRMQDIKHLDIMDAFEDRLETVSNMMYGDIRILMLYTFFEGIKQLMVTFTDETIIKNGLMNKFRKRVLRMYFKNFKDLDNYQRKDYLKLIIFPNKYRNRVLDLVKNEGNR